MKDAIRDRRSIRRQVHGGGVWLGEILKSGAQVKALLGAPEAYELMAAVALGHPQGPLPKGPGRKPLSDPVFFRK